MHMHVNGNYAHSDIQRAATWPHSRAMPKSSRRKTYLREWRRVKPGRTLEIVAEQLHMSQPQLGRIERGESPYNQDLLEALADLYGCSVADLLMRDPSNPDAMWTLWEQAKPGERAQIVKVASALIDGVRDGTTG